MPGLEASRLYDGDNQLWEPNRNADVEKLYLDGGGQSLNKNIFTRDVIDEANILPIAQKNIYKSFLEDLDDWKNEDKIIADYAAAPYDWRLSLADILAGGDADQNGHIFYAQKPVEPYIIRELKRLAAGSKSGKVTIVAHSNGGLVAKALAKKLGAEAESLIDKIVLVAVPQTGTPQAIGGLLHGYDQGLPADWLPFFLSPQTARTLAQNMPGAYQLLPTEAYFSGEGSETKTSVISFKASELTDGWIGKFGEAINNFAEFKNFLLDDTQKVAPDSSDTAAPIRVNAGLLAEAEETHKDISDDWEIPAGISVYQIAGFGEETLSSIKYWTGTECLAVERGYCLGYRPKLQYSPEMSIGGDGTVVAPSALAMSEKENVKRFWVDLDDFNIPVVRSIEHADILEIPQLRDLIKNNILTKTETLLPEFISNSQPNNKSQKRLQYILHSPLALSVQDGEGRKIGAQNSDIPGARFRRFGEVQFISLPASVPHTLKLDGQAEGSFTLEMREVENDKILAETAFAGIPTTAETEALMTVADGAIANAGPLQIDYDGDRQIDFSLHPKSGETVFLPPPDQTPPEARISFDQNTNLVKIEGIDDNPTTVAYAEIISPKQKKSQNRDKVIEATIKDQAGNTTVLEYVEKVSNPEKRKVVLINFIKYNDEEKIVFLNSMLKYKWRKEKDVSSYKLFASHIRAEDMAVEAHFRPKKNITLLMVRPLALDDGEDDGETDQRPVKQKLPGLVIPYLETGEGELKIAY